MHTLAPSGTESEKRRGQEIQRECQCTHCALPVPQGLIVDESETQFCCGGCRTAYQLIKGNGLDAWYAMSAASRNEASLKSRDPAQSARFADFDQPAFMEKFGKAADAVEVPKTRENANEQIAANPVQVVPRTSVQPYQDITLLLDGIHCAACIWLIEKLPEILPGVVDANVSWARRTVDIRWLPQEVKLSRIAELLFGLGYTPHPIRVNANDQRRKAEHRQQLIRIGIAGAAAGNNMLIAASLYLGMFSYMSANMVGMMRIASCVVGMASLLGPGRVFLRGAWNAIRTRTAHMDLPVALGLTVGATAGLVNTIRGTGEIWFDSLSVLIFLLLVGRWIQFLQQNRAADAVEMLYRLTPKTARKIVAGVAVETYVDLIEPGELLEIRPGDMIAVDAEIVEGTTSVDESILSGESRQVKKSAGETLLAGTKNGNSRVVVKALAIGRETRLGKIVDLVERAAHDKPEIVQRANRIGGWFVTVIIFLATLTLLAWLWIDSTIAVDRAVALLIVACPCALALATPLAISVALGRAAGRRILVKGGDVLQQLNTPGIIWLDKTGTLTEGKMEVTHWYGDQRWRLAVATVEEKSSHPIARAFVAFSETVKQDLSSEANPEAMNVVEFPQGGIRGMVGDRDVLIGTRKLLESEHINCDEHWSGVAKQIVAENLSPCWIAVDSEVVGLAALGDSIRRDAQTAIDQLKAAGWRVGILSGDHVSIVSQIAKRLGIGNELAIGAATPETKVEVIKRSFEEHETVAMVGDGVNDSAALAAASVGIAVHNGAEACLAAAHVYLAEEGLEPILDLMQVSRSTCRTISLNFNASLAYNILGASLAAFGFINPLIAAILMPISSLTVVAISLTSGKTSVKTAIIPTASASSKRNQQ